MKKIYEKRKSANIREQALQQMRETRERIVRDNPDLLESVRRKLEVAQDMRVHTENQDSVKIDRQKNLLTVLRFIELKPHSNALKSEIKSILQD